MQAATRLFHRLHVMSEAPTCHLRSEAHTAGTVYAARHDCLYERPQILVLHCALDLRETPPIATEYHRLHSQMKLVNLSTASSVHRLQLARHLLEHIMPPKTTFALVVHYCVQSTINQCSTSAHMNRYGSNATRKR